MDEPRELSLIADGARMLAEARGLFEVRNVRSVALAAVTYARAKDMGEDAVRSAQRIVILSTVRLGEEIAAGQERREIANPSDRPAIVASDSSKATLKDLGISLDLSSNAKRLAANPEAVRHYLDHAAEPSLTGALHAVSVESGKSWDATVQAMSSPATIRAAGIDRFHAHLQDAARELEALSPPLVGAEAEPFLITAGAIVRKMGRGKKLEAV